MSTVNQESRENSTEADGGVGECGDVVWPTRDNIRNGPNHLSGVCMAHKYPNRSLLQQPVPPMLRGKVL